MATKRTGLPAQGILTSTPVPPPAYSDQEDRDILSGGHTDHTLGNRVAEATETPQEAEIDHRMGLRGAQGRTPVPEDFTDLLTPEGDSGDIVGSDISDSPFMLGEDGSTVVP